jgi:protein TonB
MFEDATFESNGRIKTRSRRWMLVTFALNGAVLAVIVLLPLIYPEALQSKFLNTILITPPVQASEPPKTEVVHTDTRQSEFSGTDLIVPTKIPTGVKQVKDEGPPGDSNDISKIGIPGGDGPPVLTPFHRDQPHVEQEYAIRISSAVIEGLLIDRRVPSYPSIARAAHVQGTVVLAAFISKQGTIENMRIVSGPAMLQQAALDAVGQWRYRPYMLNGEPVEVETTVNVVFSLNN